MQRRALRVTGLVQGVGYRPFVCGLAARLGLSGFVRNVGADVAIEVEGPAAEVDVFVAELETAGPPLARLEAVSAEARQPEGRPGFFILPSERGDAAPVSVSADVAPCAACLQELFEPSERRYRYPLLSCADCGPRFTLIVATPYDRERTSMAAFPMCAECRAQYEDANDRRFHAQPIACPACGPRVVLDAPRRHPRERDAVAAAAASLREGAIIAVKGVGGYHLACDAASETAVATLRARKHRDEKPFAVLVPDVRAAARLCVLSENEAAVLASPRRPIVLARLRAGARLASGVAPRSPFAGVMLPSSPLQALLAADFGDGALVMTSGNVSDEPILFDDEDARARLAPLADEFLRHDRVIQTRCDDSVVRVVDRDPLLLRRARGYAPEPIRIRWSGAAPILATGGHMKAAFALASDGRVVLSHHLGDLGELAAYAAYEEAIVHYEGLFGVRPRVVAHDAHPDYASTRYAIERAARDGLALVGIQHHRAHLASCLADNDVGADEDVIGVVLDGSGLGDDGSIWGGELFVGGIRSAVRAGHLRPVAMPGGERAIREPWRMALAHLVEAGASVTAPIAAGTTAEERRIVLRMIDRRTNAPSTSSMGRLFDAVSAITGFVLRASYDAHAAVELEWAAWRAAEDREALACAEPYDFSVHDPGGEGGLLEIDPRACVRAIAADVARGAPQTEIAWRFHATVCAMIVAACTRLRARTGIRSVALSGGVFANGLLAEHVPRALAAASFRVYTHRRVPPNDGGLSFGQIAVAAARAGVL